MAFVVSVTTVAKRRRCPPKPQIVSGARRRPQYGLVTNVRPREQLRDTAETRVEASSPRDGHSLAAVAARATGSKNSEYFREVATQRFLSEVHSTYGLLSREEQTSMGQAIFAWRQLQQQTIELSQQLGRHPDDEEIAQARGLSVAVLRERRIFGQAARETMVASNLLLVVKVASRLKPSGGLDTADLVSDGAIGLVKAVDLWNPFLGVPFATYAWRVIHAHIVRAIYNTANLIRVPEYRMKELFRMRKTALQLRESEQGQWPSPEKVALTMDITLKELAILYECSSTMSVASLDVALPNSLNSPAQCIGDLIPSTEDLPMDRLDVDLTVARVRRVLGQSLKAKQLEAVILRFGMDGGEAKSYREIGRALGVSYVRAHSLVRSAIVVLQEDSDVRRELEEAQNDLYLAAR